MSDRMDIERAGYPGPDGPAPLSPIALDIFKATEEATQDRFLHLPNHGLFTMTHRIEAALNAQLRAIVARVAQEEREKCAWELEHHRYENHFGKTRRPSGFARAARFLLRGTP